MTVTAETTRDLRARRDEAARAGADVVELRLDGVADLDVAGALEGSPCRVIVACHPSWEGGRFDGPEEARARILRQALDLGADWVDVEWKANLAQALDRSQLPRVVLSHHVFEGVPGDLRERMLAMRGIGAGIVKVAVASSSLGDVLRLRTAGCVLEDGRKVLLAMGPSGWTTRLLPWRFGTAWTYAGSIGAVGQLSYESMIGDYRFRDVTPAADVYAVVGRPIAHSLSPVMHNAAFRECGRDAVYVPLESADADDLLMFAREMRLCGVSITAPLKVSLFERADRRDEMSTRVGACNTLRFTDGCVEAINTDVDGFLAPLDRRGIALDGVRAAIVGGGGAARAAAVALSSHGSRVTVHTRRSEQAAELSEIGGVSSGAWPIPAGSWDLLVNTTPVGTAPHANETPFDGPFLTAEALAKAVDGPVVYDLVYNPRQTRLLREAARAGCQTIDGLEMLVAQACGQFEWWTGEPAPREVMLAAAEKRLMAQGSRLGEEPPPCLSPET